ncbi:MAG: hypothetical protein KDA52_09385 [Planctomycetaceae bacterium]|nr:hypothetical protein [Planctomycetaceae bacterium]
MAKRAKVTCPHCEVRITVMRTSIDGAGVLCPHCDGLIPVRRKRSSTNPRRQLSPKVKVKRTRRSRNEPDPSVSPRLERGERPQWKPGPSIDANTPMLAFTVFASSVVVTVLLVALGRPMLAGFLLSCAGMLCGGIWRSWILTIMYDDGRTWFEAHYVPGIELYYTFKYWRNVKHGIVFAMLSACFIVAGGIVFVFGLFYELAEP